MEIAKREDVKEVLQDIKNYSSLKAVKSTEGGKILIENLNKDLSQLLVAVLLNYRYLPHTELIVLLSKAEAKYDLLLTLNRAGKNKQLALETLKEITEEEEFKELTNE